MMNTSTYTILGFLRFAFKKSSPFVKRKFLLTHLFIFITAIFDNAVSFSLILIIRKINETNILSSQNILDYIRLNNGILFTLIIYLFFLVLAVFVRSKALLYSFKSAALISISSDNILLKKFIFSKFEKASYVSSSELINLIINHSTALNYNLFYPYFMVLYSILIITFFSLVFILNLPKLAIFTLISLYLIYLLLYKIERKKVISLSETYSKASKNLSIKLLDSVKLFRETRLNQAEHKLSEELNIYQKNVRISQANVAFKGKMPRFIIESIILFSLALLAYKSKMVSGNILENSKFQIALLCIGRLYPAFQTAYANISNMIASKASIRAYLDLYKRISKGLNYISEFYFEKNKLAINTKEQIEFDSLKIKNIDFYYEKNKQLILENASVDLKKGERVFIKGNSGSGKTTLINIIMGLLDPKSGEIIFKSSDKLELKNGNGQKLFSLVSQTPYLKNATIIENITEFSEIKDIDKDLLNECLKIADCLSFIKKLEKGIFEVVGEGGLTLSGGQQQRLTIARALYRKKPILVLDEATNSLDLKSQQKILSNIIKSRPETTILAICHDQNAKDFFSIEWEIHNRVINRNLLSK